MVLRSDVMRGDVVEFRLSRKLQPGKHRVAVIFIPDDASVYEPSRSKVLVLTVKRANRG